MNSDMLANAMIFADSLNMQHEQYMLNVVYPQGMAQRGLPGFLNEQIFDNYYVPSRWYSHMSQLEQEDFIKEKNTINSFELIDGKTTKTYAMCAVGDYEDSSIVVALTLGYPNKQQIVKIKENINEILLQNTDKKVCYLAIYGGCLSEYLKELTNGWKKVSTNSRGALLFMRTGG